MTPLRRYLTFSLRTLFILLTALAVWLGVAVNRAREQREAVEAIEAAGGEVRYDWQFRRIGGIRVFDRSGRDGPTAPTWLRQTIGDDFFQEVKEAWFFENATEEAFLALSHLPSLQHAGFISGMHVGFGPLFRASYTPHADIHDEHIKPLSRLVMLESLDLSGTSITDKALTYLTALPRLRSLNLQGTNITRASIQTLQCCNTLRELDVAGTAIADARSMKQLQRALPQCNVMGNEWE